MPISTPNRLNQPIQLEQYKDPGIIRQVGGLAIPYYQASDKGTLLAGEPVHYCNRVCISKKPILPGEWGTVYSDWIAEFLLDPELAAEITLNEVVYWDLDIDAVTEYNGTTVLGGIGAATNVLPTNGLILGRAVTEGPFALGENGSNEMVCASTSSERVMVASMPGATTFYGTGSGS